DYHFSPWWAAFVPAGTPPAIVAKIENWVGTISKTEDAAKFLDTMAALPVIGDADWVRARIASDRPLIDRLAAAGNLQPPLPGRAIDASRGTDDREHRISGVKGEILAQFKIVTPKGTSFAVAGGGYEYENEALEPLGLKIVEIDASSENSFIDAAHDADAV